MSLLGYCSKTLEIAVDAMQTPPCIETKVESALLMVHIDLY